MKRILLSLSLIICHFSFSSVAAQKRITHEYNNVSLSEALLQLNNEVDDYEINFIYNELEDFRITTSVYRQTVPDAIRQMIGFYPVRMSVDNNEIIVECVQKTAHRYIGTVVDEADRPVAYANITLLHPADSSLVGGGVSNEDGLFVIPAASKEAILRVSFVGYKTEFLQPDTYDVGTIRLKPETIVLNGVQVTGERILSKAENGRLVYNMPMLLQVYPADDAFEALTRIPGVIDMNGSLLFCGQQVTLIINGKATTLEADKVVERLKAMPADMLAKVEVMPSAPAKYHVRGMAINVVTKDFTGTNQLSGQNKWTWKQSRYGTGYWAPSVIYNRGKLSMDLSYSYTKGSGYGQVEHEANHPIGEQRKTYNDKTRSRGVGLDHDYRIGMDYAFSDDHRLSLAYTGEWNSTRSTNTTTGTAVSTQHSHQHDYLHNVDVSYAAPFGLELSASYTNYQNPRTQNLDGEMYNTRRDLFVDSRQKVGKWLFTADQTHPLPKGWELSYGVKAQFTNNNSYQTTLDTEGKTIPDATTHVDYDERILNAYAGFSKQMGDALSIDASVTAEQYHATQWDEWRVYPQFSAMWNINAKNMLNLAFSSEAVYPSYWSTMSSIYYSSVYSEIWGNPDLKPMSKYDVNLMWQLNRKYTFMAFVTLEPDYFVQLAYQPTDRMAVVMKETNFDYSNYYGLQASAQFRVGRWLNGTVNATGLYRHDKSSDFFDLPFDRTRLSAILGGTAVAKLSSRHNIQFILNPFFQSKAVQGVYDIDPLFMLNASLRWTSDNGKWSVIASGNNIFNGYANTRNTLGNQDFGMRVWMNYASASLTAIYRIGNFKEKKKKEVDTSRMGY